MGLVAFFFSWVVTVAVVKVLAVGQARVLGSDVSFLSANHNENQNIKLNKNKSTLHFCRKSL